MWGRQCMCSCVDGRGLWEVIDGPDHSVMW